MSGKQSEKTEPDNTSGSSLRRQGGQLGPAPHETWTGIFHNKADRWEDRPFRRWDLHNLN